jgi:hypothetical protein
MIHVKLNNDHSVGLGDNLCLLSALANLPDKVELFVNNDHNTFDRLTQYKNIFCIEDEKLKIIETASNGDFNNVGWPVKLFTDYYRPKHVRVNEELLELNSDMDKKKFIAVITSHEIQHEDLWPWCRARPIEYWGRIMAWVKGLGYEVVTLDDPYVDLEDKINFLVKNCKAMISYEGGMAHLSHMLDIPCFIVDWRHPNRSTNLGQYHCEFVHKTDNVHILRNGDEHIFSWNREIFDNFQNGLLEGKTNNRLVNGELELVLGSGAPGQVELKESVGDYSLGVFELYNHRSRVLEMINTYYQ